MTRTIGVVGGGITGTMAAYATKDADVEVSLFEARETLGGRMATAEDNGCRYDYGANALTTPEENALEALRDAMGDELVCIEYPIRHHDEEGNPRGPDDDGERWVARSGMASIPDGLARSSGATVHTETPVVDMDRTDDGWTLTTEAGVAHEFDAVVLAVPGPAAVDILSASDWDDPLCADLADAARNVTYRAIPVFVAHYPFEIDVPYFGVIEHPDTSGVVRAFREEVKPDRVPEGESLVVCHLDGMEFGSGDVKEAHDAVVRDLPEMFNDDRLDDPDWTGYHYWGTAQPVQGVSGTLLDRAIAEDIAVVGDWLAGVSESYATLRVGYDAGKRLAEGEQTVR